MCGFVSIHARVMAKETSARDEDVHLIDLNMMRARAMVAAPRARKNGGMITGIWNGWTGGAFEHGARVMMGVTATACAILMCILRVCGYLKRRWRRRWRQQRRWRRRRRGKRGRGRRRQRSGARRPGAPRHG